MESAEWSGNYFNYFTEIEEHFQRARGTGLFILSPLDWALIESWKQAGVPLEAVLKGIDEAFTQWRSRKSKRLVNSVAYCAQAVMEAAKRAPLSGTSTSPASAPFSAEELCAYLESAASALLQNGQPVLQEIGYSLQQIASESEQHLGNLEALEQKLTTLEEKVIAVLRASLNDEDLLARRQSLERELKPYRGKMTAGQLALLERRYLDSALLDGAKLPRLSLFYLH
jgi:hypothetical protein